MKDLLHEPGVDVSHQTVRYRWHRFGPMFAAEIRKRRIEGMRSSRWLTTRAEDSHPPFRRPERAMPHFCRLRFPQEFAAVHAAVSTHFNQARSPSSRDIVKANRAAALAEWRGLGAA